jgi:hypothetical protein
VNEQLSSPKKLKKPSLIAEYASSDSSSDDDDEDIDELLNEVLEKEDKTEIKPQLVDLYPLFEVNSHAAIARLVDLADRTADMQTLRIQLEVRR